MRGGFRGARQLSRCEAAFAVRGGFRGARRVSWGKAARAVPPHCERGLHTGSQIGDRVAGGAIGSSDLHCEARADGEDARLGRGGPGARHAIV